MNGTWWFFAALAFGLVMWLAGFKAGKGERDV